MAHEASRRKMKSVTKSAPDAADVIAALPDAVFLTDMAGDIVSVNLAAQALFSTGEKNAVSKNISVFFAADHPVMAAFAQITQSGTAPAVHGCTVAGQAASVVMSRVNEHIVISVRTEIGGRGQGWIYKARESLKPAQHIARLLAHEIKNPLSGIRGAAQLLGRSMQDGDDKDLAGMIERETARIFRLIDRVNVFDDPAGDFSAVNINAAADQAIAAAQVHCARDYDPSLPEISGDHDRLVQVLLNLIKNAAEAGAGKITVRTRYDVGAVFHPDSGMKLPVILEVEDDGHGIAPDVSARLFEPYFTTKHAGEGLGLAVVSKIIDDHGGMIDVASVAGKTIFKMAFPKGKIV